MRACCLTKADIKILEKNKKKSDEKLEIFFLHLMNLNAIKGKQTYTYSELWATENSITFLFKDRHYMITNLLINFKWENKNSYSDQHMGHMDQQRGQSAWV